MSFDCQAARRLLDEILTALAHAPASDETRALLERLGSFSALSETQFTAAAALETAGLALGSMRLVPKEQRGLVGGKANALKNVAEAALAAEKQHAEEQRLARERAGTGFDATLPPAPLAHGSLHPLTQVTRELEDLFTSMGWTILDGPEVETEFYNFDALNIPGDHPARDTMDTFWVDTAPGAPRLVMRTHTSPVQVRAMQRLKPPFRAIVPGKVFRNEALDASHEHTFHQMEGLVVGRDISVGHLIGSMKTLLRGVFGRDIEIRLRPGYFPFVEPGFELDARCPFCKDGCSVCKRSTWIELLPCGMVHPNVLRAGGIDPEQWTGFAFGLGLSRLVMLRYRIDDIRNLLGGDLRFLEQF
ncbi:MAG: phenylalanine--tRNA ligase subunit alpha [Planctomycetes bacterium]|nr:phenylalanine--tRNA ligase subunit alpha [Planctomycetota bacterium]